MENILDLSLKDAALLAVNQKLILQKVGWDVYERALKLYEDSNEVHLAYDDGFLEVEAPQFKHERPAQILRDLITNICFELETDYVNAGSTTFREQAKAKGVEPDTCFYIQNESRIRGLKNIDLAQDPPPDLVIEVDITSPSLDKMPIYAALGVPEVWLYKGEKVVFFALAGGTYEEISNSIALPLIDSRTANNFLQKGLTENSTKWIREVREWVSSEFQL